MQILLPKRPEDPADGYGLQRVVFDEVAAGKRPPTLSITPSPRHVGVTKRDTHRPGFTDAVEAASAMDFPVLVRGAGGGATAASDGTFGFSMIRASTPEDSRNGISERYDEASRLVLGAFARLGVKEAEVGEVRDEFCPGDNSIRIGGWRDGMKICGIAQRLTSRATSVGGIILVHGQDELADVLEGVYGAMDLPFRRTSVGSLCRAGYDLTVGEVVLALAEEAAGIYGVEPGTVDTETMDRAKEVGREQVIEPPSSSGNRQM